MGIFGPSQAKRYSVAYGQRVIQVSEVQPGVSDVREQLAQAVATHRMADQAAQRVTRFTDPNQYLAALLDSSARLAKVFRVDHDELLISAYRDAWTREFEPGLRKYGQLLAKCQRNHTLPVGLLEAHGAVIIHLSRYADAAADPLSRIERLWSERQELLKHYVGTIEATTEGIEAGELDQWLLTSRMSPDSAQHLIFSISTNEGASTRH
jgi:hypothetical protein